MVRVVNNLIGNQSTVNPIERCFVKYNSNIATRARKICKNGLFIFTLLGIFLPHCDTQAQTICTTEVEQALRAHKILIDNLDIVNNLGLNGLTQAQLRGIVCSEVNLINLTSSSHHIQIGYSGNNKQILVFQASYRTCSINFVINKPQSEIQEISAVCAK